MTDEPAVRGERFSGGPARSFLSSLAGDERIFAADLAVDRAHVVMLAEQGIVTDETAGAILRAVADVERAGHGALPDGEDVHEAVESAVIDRVGSEGGRMHTARSRNDEVATCLRYRLRTDTLAVAEGLVALRAALLGLAEEHATTVIPGYTHLQPAQPTTVGHWALSYEASLARDTARALDAYDRTNRSPLGAAAFAGTTFDVDRDRTAELLGFDGLVRNATDAVAARDFLVETGAVLAGSAVTVSGLAEDLLLFANRGLWTPDDDYASRSSIMPQKVNPDTLELARGVAGDAVGELVGTLTTLKGLPRAYNRDLQRGDPHVWRAVDATRDALDATSGAVATGEWDEAAARRAASEGFSTATGVADLLAANGVPFRTAHETVARAAQAVEAALDPTGATAASGGNGSSAGESHATEAAVAALDEAARETLDAPLAEYVSLDAVREALDPAASVAARDSTGGPAPEQVRADHASAADRLADDRRAIGDRRDALDAASDALAAEVATYV